MTGDRDVAAFDRRAPGYEDGWRGRLHHDIADRAADLAKACAPNAKRVLDVGCGTGYLLRRLADAMPSAEVLRGIDPAPAMIRVAESRATDPRLRFMTGVAELLPYDDDAFDLVISTTSFDHWADQRGGLTECHRVLRPGGRLVLCDQFSVLLWPTLLGGRRTKARTKHRATALLRGIGFISLEWHRIYTVPIRAVTAFKPDR